MYAYCIYLKAALSNLQRGELLPTFTFRGMPPSHHSHSPSPPLLSERNFVMSDPKESVLNHSQHLEASLLVHWVFCRVSGLLWAFVD